MGDLNPKDEVTLEDEYTVDSFEDFLTSFYRPGTLKLDYGHRPERSNQCGICLEPMESMDHTVTHAKQLTPLREEHKFNGAGVGCLNSWHAECLSEYWKRLRTPARCPCCRSWLEYGDITMPERVFNLAPAELQELDAELIRLLDGYTPPPHETPDETNPFFDYYLENDVEDWSPYDIEDGTADIRQRLLTFNRSLEHAWFDRDMLLDRLQRVDDMYCTSEWEGDGVEEEEEDSDAGFYSCRDSVEDSASPLQ